MMFDLNCLQDLVLKAFTLRPTCNNQSQNINIDVNERQKKIVRLMLNFVENFELSRFKCIFTSVKCFANRNATLSAVKQKLNARNVNRGVESHWLLFRWSYLFVLDFTTVIGPLIDLIFLFFQSTDGYTSVTIIVCFQFATELMAGLLLYISLTNTIP